VVKDSDERKSWPEKNWSYFAPQLFSLALFLSFFLCFHADGWICRRSCYIGDPCTPYQDNAAALISLVVFWEKLTIIHTFVLARGWQKTREGAFCFMVVDWIAL
jgi:hypothetical protein